MEIRQLDQDGRWWRVGRHDVDLSSDTVYPPNVRACALLHRDGVGEDAENLAVLVTAQVEAEDCTALQMVTGWLFAQSQAIVRGTRERVVSRAA